MICPITTLSYLGGTAFLGLGTLGLATPARAQLVFGVRPATAAAAPAASPETRAFIYSKAGRDLMIGTLLVLFQYRRDKPAVTALIGVSAVGGLIDGIAVRSLAPADLRYKAWAHFIGAGFLLALAAVRYKARLW